MTLHAWVFLDSDGLHAFLRSQKTSIQCALALYPVNTPKIPSMTSYVMVTCEEPKPPKNKDIFFKYNSCSSLKFQGNLACLLVSIAWHSALDVEGQEFDSIPYN